MIIVTDQDYLELKNRMGRDIHFIVPVHSDIYKHRVINTILCTGVIFLNGDVFVVSNNHRDAPRFSVNNTEHTINERVLYYISTGNEPIELESFFTKFIHDSHHVFQNIRNINSTIPLMVWSTVIKQYVHTLSPYFSQWELLCKTELYKNLSQSVKTLENIEYSGLHVDVDIAQQQFGNKITRYVQDNLIYSQYNPFTVTGRPSNRFGGVNFAALNKHDDTRTAFTSRFENGILVQMDFDAYHLRLLASIAGIELPKTSLHQYLATEYFGKQDISEEEYDLGKQYTFSVLYGAKELSSTIPFLQKIKEVSRSVYNEYVVNGHISSALFKRPITIQEELTDNKVFNYFVQSLEFESTIPVLQTVLHSLTNQSKLILYTYDAILLDCHPDELTETITQTKRILERDSFPVKVQIGKNYKDLITLGDG